MWPWIFCRPHRWGLSHQDSFYVNDQSYIDRSRSFTGLYQSRYITSYNLLNIVFAYILILFNLALAHPECNIEFSPCLKAAYSHQPQISPLKVLTGIKSSCINAGTSRNQCHINVSLANRSTTLQSTKKAHAVVGYDEKEQNGRTGWVAEVGHTFHLLRHWYSSTCYDTTPVWSLYIYVCVCVLYPQIGDHHTNTLWGSWIFPAKSKRADCSVVTPFSETMLAFTQ